MARRGLGAGAIAAERISPSLRSASSRFWSCDRCALALTVSTPLTRRGPSRSSALRLRCSGSAVVWARSKTSSTRESVVFTPCPPGPDEREKRQLTSAAGITDDPRTGMSAGMGPDCHSATSLTPMPILGRIAARPETPDDMGELLEFERPS